MANKYTNRELLDYKFNENDYEDVSLAKQTANDALTKYNSVGDWKYGKEDQYSKALDALTNRKAFSYDLNGDALYQQYKDNYIQQGKMAMQDAMGQAAAMTGGYGNSYAATVGNQAYQGYLQGLNDKVPELYQLAMQRYNMEGDNLKAAYDVLKGDRDSDYGMFMDNKTMLQNDVQLYNNLYDAAYTREQTNYNNTLSSNNDNYWNEYNTGYKAEQDSIANKLAQDQLKLQQDEFAWNKSQSNIAAKYANYINPDDIEVDENGNIVSVKGFNIAGSSDGDTSVGTLASGAEVTGFRSVNGDNFKVKVGDETVTVENKGKVDDTDIVNRLNRVEAGNNQIINLGGDLYVKHAGGYYKVGATNGLFGIGETKGYSNLLGKLG